MRLVGACKQQLKRAWQLAVEGQVASRGLWRDHAIISMHRWNEYFATTIGCGIVMRLVEKRPRGEKYMSIKSLHAASTLSAALALIFVVPSHGQETPFVPVSDEVLQNPAPSDWLQWRRDQQASGFSPLNEVTRENVADLRLAWSWAMPDGRQEQEFLPRLCRAPWLW